MYKNFNLTESEREQILKQHQSHGYKKPLNEQEVGGYKEGPGEKQTPELNHYSKIVKPQLSNAGFKDAYEKNLVPYGTENSMVYGNHNTGVNVVWDRKKGIYSVYVGNNKGLKTFSLGPADSRLVANNVVKYALSLKNRVSLNEQYEDESMGDDTNDGSEQDMGSSYNLVVDNSIFIPIESFTVYVSFDEEDDDVPVRVSQDEEGNPVFDVSEVMMPEGGNPEDFINAIKQKMGDNPFESFKYHGTILYYETGKTNNY